MNKIFFYLLIYLFASNLSHAQNNQKDSVESNYLEYFKLSPETIYTHLNKSKYLVTENLWFKSYIYNTKTQQPYLSTTNVYAAIYDSEGNLITKKLLYAENGMTYGDFNLSEYNPGLYYLKVSTNYMRNFNEKHYSLQQFEILGSKNSQPSTEIVTKKYDFQLLPEGGHILNNVTNTIGFKILNTLGEGVIIESGNILDSKNQVVTTFKSNEFGMGKFSILIKEDELYRVEATLDDGTVINQQLPDGNDIGITLSVNNLNSKSLFISIQTNKKTLPYLLNKSYFIIAHRDGLLKRIDFKFQENQYDYIIPISKSDLLTGINILTVFNEVHKPIAERMLYNHNKPLIDDIELVGIKTGIDSTEIRLKTSKRDSIKKAISISVLPASTKAYDFNDNIISAFLLNHYVKGIVENPSYYFKNTDRQTIYNLDLLLLTQGWSRYSWHAIFNSPPKELFHFESGMQIKGKVSNKGKNNEILFFNKESNTMLTSEITSDGYFSFENVFLTDSTTIYFSLSNKKGMLSKAIAYTNIYPNYIEDNINTLDISKTKQLFDTTFFQENFTYNNTTILDTVSIEASVFKPKNRIINGKFNGNYIDLNGTYSDVTLVRDVIGQNGFDVYSNHMGLQILSRRGYSTSSRSAPNVYLDNRLLNSEEYYLLSILTVNDIEELYISRTPSAGTGGLGGNINIFTKKSYSDGIREKQSSFASKIVDFGYSVPQKYFSPFYNKSYYVTYSEYGVLNWLPNLFQNDDGEFVFKIPNYTFEKVRFHIEGMAQDGRLISKTETISIDK